MNTYTIQYDIIIVGGGIAGLYTMYELSKKNPTLRVLLLEKNKSFGGRVDTGYFGKSVIEKGAGRFSRSHSLLNQLIEELHLSHHTKVLNSNAVYMPSKGQGIVEKSVFDAPSYYESPSFLENAYNYLLGPIIGIGNDTIPSAGLVAKVIIMSKMVSKHTLQNQTFLQFAKSVLHKNQIEYIEKTFGFYSELHIMNAYDCIRLMTELNPNNTFYSLKDGFSQLIFRMMENIQKNKQYLFLSNQTVTRILPQESWFQVHAISEGSPVYYIGKKIVCALPKQALEKLHIFKPIQPLLSKVNTSCLCRIYSQFEVKNGEEVWFKHLTKFTTDNYLRMVLPIDVEKGIIMISYTDNKFADYWNQLYKSKGVDRLNQKIKELIQESTGLSIPKPKKTQLFYWKHGVGYWGVGSDSETVSERLIQPFDNMDVYICGEHYSAYHQQWMEGALETSREVLNKMGI